MYELRVTRNASKFVKKLSKRDQDSVFDALDALVLNPRPHGVKKLQGTTNSWRIRVGKYRVMYEIHDDVLVVQVIEIAHRRDAYR